MKARANTSLYLHALKNTIHFSLTSQSQLCQKIVKGIRKCFSEVYAAGMPHPSLQEVFTASSEKHF
jgi:hypothetical protein